MTRYIDKITMADGNTYTIVDPVSQGAAEEARDIAVAAAQDARDAAAEAAEAASLGVRLDYLEALALNQPSTERAVAELQACCEAVGETVAGFALALAELTERWQYSLGAIFAPTAEACTVSDAIATTQGTVSDTTLTLS